MLMMQQLLQSIRPDDWLTNLDLKNTCFHIPIKPVHRKYLWVAFQGTASLSCHFGLSLTLHDFSRSAWKLSWPIETQRHQCSVIWTTGSFVPSLQLRQRPSWNLSLAIFAGWALW